MPATFAASVRRPRSRILLAILAVIAVAVVLLLALRPVIANLVAGKLRAVAAERGLMATWRTLAVGLGSVRIDDLTLTSAGGDTVFAVQRMSVGIAPVSLLLMRPRARSITLDHGHFTIRSGSAADPDTLNPPPPSSRRMRTDHPERAQQLVRAARQAVSLLFVPAPRLPRVRIAHLLIAPAAANEPQPQDGYGGIDIDSLTVDPTPRGARLLVQGTLRSVDPVPFTAHAAYGRDDRLSGLARFVMPGAHGGESETLSLGIDGVMHQYRRAGVVRLGDSTRVKIGALPVTVAGAVWRRGPRFELAIAADGVTAAQVHRSLPASLLGPLLEVSVSGSFDYRLHFDLDLTRPDQVDFTADVIPHDLRLNPADTRLRLAGLDAPFTAAIHLPHNSTVRELSPANPHFRRFEEIDSLLTHAVVTNEDGGFFRHRGFNTEAVKQAIAENLRAGAFRRGAGTITMQLARNLYLGHQRTLARKMQEVVLAWVLEHLTGVGKRRLLEIYFNIIEWGPGVHGADEATHYYFDRDPSRLTIDESLFLATIVPAPLKWRYRFDSDGALRPFARDQMHFIGRAMISKGWLDPAALPAAELLQVELRGPARDVVRPPAPDTVTADRTNAALVPLLP